MALMTGYREDLQRKLVARQRRVIAYPRCDREPRRSAEQQRAARGAPRRRGVGRVAYGQGSLSSADDPQGARGHAARRRPGRRPAAAAAAGGRLGADGGRHPAAPCSGTRSGRRELERAGGATSCGWSRSASSRAGRASATRACATAPSRPASPSSTAAGCCSTARWSSELMGGELDDLLEFARRRSARDRRASPKRRRRSSSRRLRGHRLAAAQPRALHRAAPAEGGALPGARADRPGLDLQRGLDPGGAGARADARHRACWGRWGCGRRALRRGLPVYAGFLGAVGDAARAWPSAGRSRWVLTTFELIRFDPERGGDLLHQLGAVPRRARRRAGDPRLRAWWRP